MGKTKTEGVPKMPNLKNLHPNDKIKLWRSVWAVLFQVFAAFFGFFSARCEILNSMFPLGLGFAGGVPLEFLPSASLGAFCGYIIMLIKGGGFSYITALFAVSGIRLIVKNRKKLSQNPIFRFGIITSFAIICGVAESGSNINKIVTVLGEGIIAGGEAYFLAKCSAAKYYGGRGSSFDETASLVISACLILTPLCGFKISEISLGEIAGMILLLVAAKAPRSGLGSVCGIALGCSLIFSGNSPKSAIIIMVSGAFCEVLSSSPKLVQSLGLLLPSILTALPMGKDSVQVSLLIEAVAACLVFALLPTDLINKTNSILAPRADIENFDGLRKAIVDRLSFASSAMRDVCETVETVSKRLSELNSPDFEKVMKYVENEACRGCSFFSKCWEINRAETTKAMLSLSYSFRKGNPVSVTELPVNFAERCLRLERVENSFFNHFGDFCRKTSAEERIGEMREVVTDQFFGMSDMLSDMADEFRSAQKFDTAKAAEIVSALKTLDINAASCGCCTDKHGRINLEITLAEAPSLPFNRLRVLNLLQNICGREFETPVLTKVGDGIRISVAQKANFSVEYAKSSYNCNNNISCGDAAKCFFDGRGRFYMLLCDGMGNGGRAAVDGTMALGLMERLLKSGFGYDCSLKIINSAMIFKSTDESLSTVDIACVDLFSGETELLKAGAAPTIVRRNGRTGKAECHCLPIGILKSVEFDRATVTLDEDDILLLMSDGAVGGGTDWICAEIEAWQDGSAKQLADHILNCAQKRQGAHEDDITVVSAILQKTI